MEISDSVRQKEDKHIRLLYLGRGLQIPHEVKRGKSAFVV